MGVVDDPQPQPLDPLERVALQGAHEVQRVALGGQRAFGRRAERDRVEGLEPAAHAEADVRLGRSDASRGGDAHPRDRQYRLGVARSVGTQTVELRGEAPIQA